MTAQNLPCEQAGMGGGGVVMLLSAVTASFALPRMISNEGTRIASNLSQTNSHPVHILCLVHGVKCL